MMRNTLSAATAPVARRPGLSVGRMSVRGRRTLWSLVALPVLCVWGLAGEVRAQTPHEQAFTALVEPWKARIQGKKPDKVLQDCDTGWNAYEEARGIAMLTEGQPEYPATVKKRDETAKKALPLLQDAVAAAESENAVPLEKRQELLLRLAQCAADVRDFPLCGVVAEYFARKYPAHETALGTAQLANASYLTLLSQAGTDEAKAKPFRDKVLQLNEFVTKQWPNTEEAKDARGRLAQLALSSGDSAQALAIAAKLPENSPQRAEIQLKMGLIQWNEYLISSKPAGNAPRPSEADLEKKRLATKKALGDGVGLLRKLGGNDPSYTLLAGELALAQIHLEEGDAAAALAVLQRPKTGLLDLVLASAPVASDKAFRQQVLGSALRAFLQTQNLDQAEAMLEQLAKLSGDGAKISSLRMSMARQLAKDIQESEKSGGDPKALAERSRGLAALLKKIAADKSSLDFGATAWVAQQFLELAKRQDPGGLLEADDKTAAPALAAYKEAADLYAKLQVQAGGAGPDSAERKNLNGVRFNLAKCNRRLGKFQEAADIFEEVLMTAPKNVDAQLEAAANYQDWGDSTNDRTYWGYAIRGGPPRRYSMGMKDSPVMGWYRLAAEIRTPSDKYAKEFYNTRYNLELCRAKAALDAPDAEKRELLSTSERSILALYTVHPEVGEGELKAKFEPLLRSLQAKLGRKDSGFPSRDALAEANATRGGAAEPEVKKPRPPVKIPASTWYVVGFAGVALILACAASWFVFKRSKHPAMPRR